MMATPAPGCGAGGAGKGLGRASQATEPKLQNISGWCFWKGSALSAWGSVLLLLVLGDAMLPGRQLAVLRDTLAVALLLTLPHQPPARLRVPRCPCSAGLTACEEVKLALEVALSRATQSLSEDPRPRQHSQVSWDTSVGTQLFAWRWCTLIKAQIISVHSICTQPNDVQEHLPPREQMPSLRMPLRGRHSREQRAAQRASGTG